MSPYTLMLQLLLMVSPIQALICQNGATRDVVYDRCLCTPHYHGAACQLDFRTNNPCTSSLTTTLTDTWGAQRPGNHRLCSSTEGTCLDFSTLSIGWYRLRSPAGNRLTEGCGPNPKHDCGSQAPYVVHQLVREDTNSRALFSGKAYRLQNFPNGACYLSGKNQQTHFPVRKLICSPDLTLYFLYPLRVGHHYCIGQPSSKQPAPVVPGATKPTDASSPGFVQNAKQPKLLLVQYPLMAGNFQGLKFTCTVYGLSFKQFKTEYTVEFLVTDKRGSTREIKSCKVVLGRSFRGSASYECPSKDILDSHNNIYGSTLVCRIRLKQDNRSNSRLQLSSNVHSFTFKFKFSSSDSNFQVENIGLLRPNDTLRLCIDTKNVPVVRETIQFYVSVGRQRTIPTDGIDVSVVHWTRNGSEISSNVTNRGCKFNYFNKNKMGEFCIDLTLQNFDPDGRVVFGRSSTEQMSLVKLNISYSSLSDGLKTYNSQRNQLQLELLTTLELKVDLTDLPTKPFNYLHVFSDPYVKPVNGTYSDNSVYELVVPPGQSAAFDALRHKILPYQVQILIQRLNGTQDMRHDSTVTKRVAVRYGNYIIRVHSSTENGSLQYEIKRKTPASVGSETTASEDDVSGVTIEATPDVVRIKFDFYGTLIYVWRFRSRHSKCTHGFVMSRREMRSLDCTNRVHKVGGEFVLDLMIVPGFFDTEGNIAGLMYSKLGSEAEIDWQSDKSLFSSSYLMPETKSHNSLYMPVEVLKLCSCNEEHNIGEKCIANVKKVQRTKRSARSKRDTKVDEFDKHQMPATQSPVSADFDQLAKKYISISEAERFCREFVKVRSKEKRFSIEFCSSAADSMAQFEFVCIRYAVTLNNYLFAESVFNSMLGMCQQGLMYNVTEVRIDNGTVANRMEEELCPNRCSGRGICLSGSCVCNSGFSGPDCAYETWLLASQPSVLSTPQQGPLCPSANCLDVLIKVTPILKSFQMLQCRIVEINDNKTSRNRQQWLIPADHMTGNLIECNLSSIHDWLKNSGTLFVVVEISVQADSWNSSNNVRWLLHQSRCSDRPVNCSIKSWSCITDGGSSCINTKLTSHMLYAIIALSILLLLIASAAAVLSVYRSSASRPSRACSNLPEQLKMQLSKLIATRRKAQFKADKTGSSLLSTAV